MINISIGKSILTEQPRLDSMPSQVRNMAGFSESIFDTYDPQYEQNKQFLSFLRKTIPILDIAVIKTLQLIGKYRIETYGNKNLEKLLNDFTRNIPVNYLEKGCYEAVHQLADSALESGTGWLEIIPNKGLNNISKLKIIKPDIIKYRKVGEDILFGNAFAGNFGFQPFKFQNLIQTLAFDRRKGDPEGYSMFYSLPFMGEIFNRIMNMIKNQIWRLGDPIFAIVIEGITDNETDYAIAEKYKNAIKSQMTDAWKNKMMGKVSDVYGATPAGAKLVIKAIGADIEIPNLEIPIRTVMEQIIAKTNFPPFFFGLHWAANYNITEHQSYMIINSIENYRESLDHVLDKVYNMFLALTGNSGAKYTRVWDDINLMDMVEQARARQLNSMAKEKEFNLIVQSIAMGFTKPDDAIDMLIENQIIPNTKKELGYDGIYTKYLENKVNYLLAEKTFKWATTNN